MPLAPAWINPYVAPMEPTAITLVSQLINDARTRFGVSQVASLAVDRELLDRAMDHVLSVGGEVTLDTCVVDGVEIRELPDGQGDPLAYLHGDVDPYPLRGDDPDQADT